ncbi:hypothetical protein BaRGS_00023300, partial [Batillaria attramentaria]
WFIGVIVTVIVRLSDTQPPDGSREPGDASFDDRHLSAEEVDEKFVRELMDRWGGQTFFLTEKDLEELETMYLKWRGSQSEKTPLYDKDICCETNNKLQPQCGKMSDVEGKEWFVMCPKIGGKQHVQYAEVGTCVSSGETCSNGFGVCHQEKRLVSLWSRPLTRPFKNKILPRLFPVNGYCSCKSN